MFYNQEYFARRKGGLGIYWLAATLGSSNTFKKLSKKEILDCNIPKAVDKLIHPEEPLALRLTSNLMFGVTRIYSYQCNYLHQNATTTSTSLKHAIIKLDIPGQAGQNSKDAIARLTLMQDGDGTTTSNGKGKGKGKEKGGLGDVRDGNGARITLNRDEGMDLLAADLGDLFNGRFDLTWDEMREQLNTSSLKGKRKRADRDASTPGLDGDEFLDELEGDEDEYLDASARKKSKTKEKNGKETAAGASAAPRRTTTVGRLEDINLPAHLMDGNQMGDHVRDDPLLFGDDAGFDPMLDLDLDFDLGLGDLPPPLDADDTHANANANRRPRDSNVTQAGELNVPNAYNDGPDTSATGFGAFDDNGPFGDIGDAFGNGIGGPGDGSFDGGVRDVSVVNGRGDTPARGAVDEVAGPPTPAPSDGINLSNAENAEAEVVNKKAPTSKKAKKHLQPVRDKFTTLHADEITRNREAYSDEMKKFNLVKNLERFERGQKELVLDMMTSLPLSVKAPAFEAFFKEALNLDNLVRNTTKGKKGKDTKKAPSTVRDPSVANEDRSIANIPRGVREGSHLSSQLGRGGLRNDRQSDFGFDDRFGDQNMDDGAMFNGQNDDFQFDNFDDGHFGGEITNEHGRPSSVAPSVARSFSLGPRGQRGSSVHGEESNYGREAAASFSVMPWNASYSSAAGFGNVPSSAARYSASRAGSVPPTPGGPRSRASSILGSYMKGRQPSMPGSIFAGNDGPYYEREGTPSRAETPGKHLDSRAPSIAPSFKFREGSAAIPEHVHSDSQVGETESQVEIRLETESRNFFRYAKGFAQPPTNEFLLSDIIPVAATAPLVAAQGFYHTLMLASKGLIKVKQQEEPYGEIRLSIPNKHLSQSQSQSQSPAIATNAD